MLLMEDFSYTGWMLDPDTRPNFHELRRLFEHMLLDPSRYLVIEVRTIPHHTIIIFSEL